MTKKDQDRFVRDSKPSDDYFLFSDRQRNAAKWRWEFLRLNKDYQKDFKRARERREKSRAPVIAAKWALRELIDPHMSFEDICREYDNPEYEDVSSKQKEYWVIEKLGGFEFDFIGVGITPLENVKVSDRYDWEDFKRDLLVDANAVNLTIDITLPDEQIKEEVIEWVRKYRAFVSFNYSKHIPDKMHTDKLQWSKYATYLKVWQLAQEGLTHQEIADQLFPDAADQRIKELEQQGYSDAEIDAMLPRDEEPLDIDTPRKRVQRNLKKARELIEGEYRKIK